MGLEPALAQVPAWVQSFDRYSVARHMFFDGRCGWTEERRAFEDGGEDFGMRETRARE